jgi:hypothetical protein
MCLIQEDEGSPKTDAKKLQAIEFGVILYAFQRIAITITTGRSLLLFLFIVKRKR